MSSIPQQLKKLQKKTGLTQAELAVQLGVTFAAFNRWINGRAEPRAKARQKIEAMLRGGSEPAWEYGAKEYATQATADPLWDLERRIQYGIVGGERLPKKELEYFLPRLRIAPERKAFLTLLLTS